MLAKAALVALLAMLLMPTTAHAAPLPNDTQLLEAKGYTNLLATGDLLIVVRYQIDYGGSAPDDHVGITFLVRLETGTTTIATNVPYPYFDSDGDGNTDGYGDGIASIYMTAAQTLAAGLTDSAGAWTVWPPTTFTVYLEGNPSSFTTIPDDATAMVAGDFVATEVAATNETALGNDVLTWANQIQSAWGLNLLVQGQQLLNSTDGGAYFTLSIAALRQMAPLIFAIRTESPTIPTAATTTGDFATASDTRLDTNQWWGQGFRTLATDMGLPQGTIEGGFITLIVVLLIFWGTKQWGTRGAALMLVFSTFVILPTAMIGLGWVDWQWGAVALVGVGLVAIVKTARDF